jgi:LuxR family maltose regulon positive regulatory protein
MFRGERAQASAAFTEVMGAGLSSGNVMFSAVAATALAGIQATAYQLHAAASTYRAAIQMIGDPSHVLGFEAHVGLAKIVYDWNTLDEAQALAQLCSALVAQAKSQSETGADLLRARLLCASGAHLEAEALLARAPGPGPTGPLTDRLREAAELRVQLLLRRGDVSAAAELARAHQLPSGLARTLLAQGQGEAALRAIESHRRNMESQQRTQESLQAMLLQALVHQAMGHMDLALPMLRACVLQAQPQGSIRLFVDEGAPMHTLLGRLRHDAGIAHYVAQLMDAFGTPVQPAMALAAASPSHLPLSAFSQRELEILRLIQAGHSNQHIGERLFLSLSTVKWHNQNIFAKLDVQRRTEAVARALQLKLL